MVFGNKNIIKNVNGHENLNAAKDVHTEKYLALSSNMENTN